MKEIVATKLTVNNRTEKGGNGKKDSNHVMLRQGILIGFSGVVISWLSFNQGSLSCALLFFHSLLFITVFTNFLAEYSQLLFNSNDNEILQRLPVTPKTALAARIVSMLVHILFITTCLSVVPLLFLLFKMGIWVGLSFFAGVVLNTLFSLLLANLFYAVMLRYTSAERFEKLLTYMQFFLIMILVLSYQLACDASSHLSIDFTAALPAWMYFTPPCYFMSVTEFALFPNHQAAFLAALGIMSNILLFIVTIRCFSSSFSTKVNRKPACWSGCLENSLAKK